MLRYFNQITSAFVIAVYMGFAAAAAIAASYGLESLRIVQVFDLDEYRIVSLMQRHLEERSLNPHGFYIYGNLYDAVGYAAIATLQRAGWNVDVHLVGLVLRLMSLCFGVLAALALAYLATLLKIPSAVAMIGSLLLLTMPDFAVYMKTVHPDTLQAALIVIAISIAFRKPGLSAAFCGGLLAGLAFATKYSGAFVLPICIAALLLPHLGSKLNVRLATELIAQCAIVVLAFLAVFAVTNPYALNDLSGLRDTMSFMAHYVATGHGKLEAADPFAWLEPARHEFGSLGVGLLVLGFVLLVVQIFVAVRTSGIRSSILCPQIQKRLILIIFVGLGLLHLVLTVRIRVPRYAYHLLPCWIALALVGWYDFFVWFTRNRVRSTQFISLVLIGLAVPQMWYDLRALGKDTRKQQAPGLVSGNALANQLDASQRIMADMYTYVPTKFASVEFIGGITRRDIASSKPDVVIFNQMTTGRAAWKTAGSKFKDQRFSVDMSYGDRATESKELITSFLRDDNWAVAYEDDLVIAFKRN